MRALCLSVGIAVIGAWCAVSQAHHGGDGRPPGAASGEGYVTFSDYSGPGGRFTFVIVFSDGDEWPVPMDVPAGVTTARDLAILFAGQVDAHCPKASGIDYRDEPGHENQALVRRKEDLQDGITVQEIQSSDPPGNSVGYQRHIIGSPAVAFFDITGATTTGSVMIVVAADSVQRTTDGKPPIQVKTELRDDLLLMGHVASLELNGQIRVLNVESEAGVGIFCSDVGLSQFGRLALDNDGDGLPDYLDCPGDITGYVNPDESDGNVDALDFLRLIGEWGSPCPGPSCLADITGPTPEVPDGNVDSLDFLLLIAQWGSPSNCPHPHP